ncbi:MAG: HlyD family efflux transporter periplasmic adaptor subunit, partial [Campylobacteraceae bacterium]
LKDKNQNKELAFYGNVDTRTVYLGFETLGKINNITKDEGERVSKDEILATLDIRKLETNLEGLEAGLLAEVAKLEKLQNGYRVEEIEDARGAFEESTANMRLAKNIYERQLKLKESKAVSEEIFVNAKYNYELSLATQKRANATLTLRINGNRIEDINAQQAAVLALVANIKEVKQNIEDSKIKSPVDGIILTRYQEVGSVVSATQRILEVSKQDEFWVKAYVDEPNLGTISQGMKVDIFTDTKTEPYSGQIGYISPVAEFTPKNIETIELRADLVYYFRVLVLNPDSKIKQGMPVTVKLKD